LSSTIYTKLDAITLPLKPGSLQAIIHAYKASVTRWCRKNGDDIFR
jgi:hypothetical protein